MSGVAVVVAENKLDCSHLLGKFLDESHYDVLVEQDMDFYAPGPFDDGPSEENVIFKFRKNAFTQEEQDAAYQGLIGAAQITNNRGIAAGPKGAAENQRNWVTEYQESVLEILIGGSIGLDGTDFLLKMMESKDKFDPEESRGRVWKRSEIGVEKGDYSDKFFDEWCQSLIPLGQEERRRIATQYAKVGISGTSYANPVHSGVAGFLGRYPRYPYGRSCSYNFHHPEKYETAFPYVRKLDKLFSELLPERYAYQKACAESLDPAFRVGGDTVFTTLTVNKSFRTAAHFDAGDLHQGFSNLNVFSGKGDFTGGYLVLPEYRVAVNIRPGDLLLINNHFGLHGNTEIKPAVEGEPFERMSLVAYFREDLLEVGSWEYETARRDFVEQRRTNPEHPEWRQGWNGVSPNMFSSKEWVEFLEKTNQTHFLDKYHPELKKQANTALF